MHGDHQRIFGGVHVAFVGDLKQHEPVGSSPLYGGAAAEAGARAVGDDAGDTERNTGGPQAQDAGARGGDADAAQPAQREQPCSAARHAAGRDLFRRLDSVFILDQAQRQADTPPGRTLRRFAELFMGNRQPSDAEIREWAIEYNSHAVTDLTPYLASSPRVVTQRQLSRSAISTRLALAVAKALGKRACVWLAQHDVDGCPVPDVVQEVLRRSANPEHFDKLPPVLVFFEVSVALARPAAHST